MKSTITQRLSLRCKFKSADTIEVAVVDHETSDCFIHLLNFREGFNMSEHVKVSENEQIEDQNVQDIVCLEEDLPESDDLKAPQDQEPLANEAVKEDK